MFGLLFHRSVFVFLPAIAVFLSGGAFGQEKSRNGWILPTQGKIRVLMVFVEIEHDVDGSADAFPSGHKQWKVNELPAYKDDVFNVFADEDTLKTLTKYYDECSFGAFQVLGDYYPEIVTLKQSEIGRSKTKLLSETMKRINASERISSEDLEFDSFDIWENTTKRGTVKKRTTDFSGVDHIMIFLRNFAPIPRATGQASGSSGGALGGFNTDSYSIFGGGDGLPFRILKHEFNHLLIGGNNFHSGGGNSANFKSYVFSVQGGWSMMGAANSSLLSPAGWDRYWLGWKPPGNQFEISVLDENRSEVNGDLLPEKGNQIYILRDFINSGDALRIKLPFIPSEEFPQWIWVENHTTYAANGSPTDRFIYEHYDCMDSAVPGLYLTRQIDANEREGNRIYTQVHADYLKPIPATGSYDYVWDDEKLDLGSCVDNRPHYVYNLLPEFENPLTGHHELEEPFYYTSDQVKIDRSDARSPGIRRNRDGTYYRHPKAGDPRYAMREGEVDFIGIGTNPTTSATLTQVNNRRGRSNNSQNSDVVYLNGISLRILETLPDLSVKVEVSFSDTLLQQERRWAGSEIILNNHNQAGADLYIESILTLDRGKTLTRFVEPDTVGGETYFSSPTVLRVAKGAKLTVEEQIVLVKDSKIIVEEGGELNLLKNGRIILENDAELIFNEGSVFSGKGKIKFKDSSNGRIEESSTLKNVKRRTCQKKRVELKPQATKP